MSFEFEEVMSRWMDRKNIRSFYAKLICTAAGSIILASRRRFCSVKREPFAGPGPWYLTLGGHLRYVQTPDDAPVFLYENVLLALDRERVSISAMPSAHACWLGACNIKDAETVVQVGAGSWLLYRDPRPSGRRARPGLRL